MGTTSSSYLWHWGKLSVHSKWNSRELCRSSPLPALVCWVLLNTVRHRTQSMCSPHLCLLFLIPSAYQLLSLLFLPYMMSLLQGTIYTNLQLEPKDLTIFIVWTNLMASIYSLVLQALIIPVLETTIPMRQIRFPLWARSIKDRLHVLPPSGKHKSQTHPVLKPGHLALGLILLNPCGWAIPFAHLQRLHSASKHCHSHL